MSLTRRLRLLFAGAVLLLSFGVLALSALSARNLVRDELARQNRQDAQALATTLGAVAGTADAGGEMLLALFDSGAYRRIRLVGADNGVRFERSATTVTRAPDAFARWAALGIEPGVAPLGRSGGGVLEIERASGPLIDALWLAELRLAGALALFAALVVTLGIAATVPLRRDLMRAVAHAESLQRGDYQATSESGLPEMRRLTRALNSTAARLRQVFDAHGAQVDLMRNEANRDPLSGLSNRGHFLDRLEDATRHPHGALAGSLVLLRLLDLAAINRRLGHPATDHIIRAIAQTLQTYSRRVDGCLIGRLNGSDFALSLPAPDVARETAEAVMELLRAVLPAFGSGIAVVAGVVESSRNAEVSRLMASVDEALGRAAARGPFAVEAIDVAESRAANRA